jgi:hypothetical protein
MRATIERQGLHADTVGPGLPFARQLLELSLGLRFCRMAALAMLHQQWPYRVFEEIGRLFCREPWHRKPDAPDDEEEWIAECKT